MTIYYVDSSVIVKRHRSERGTEATDELLNGRSEVDRF